ncbi:hypothetical protein AB0K23_31020 [Streptomyces sp. NPDC049602]|uniref:hypothetical protein n=1 Tax=Streptomyces sp. NPDC049602 TaxID=3155504 RepID=UPI003424EEEA
MGGPLGWVVRVLPPDDGDDGDDGDEGDEGDEGDDGEAGEELVPLGGADEVDGADGFDGADDVDGAGVGALGVEEDEQAVNASDAAARTTTGSAALLFHALGREDFGSAAFHPPEADHGGLPRRPRPRGSTSPAPAPPGRLERASTMPSRYARPVPRHQSPGLALAGGPELVAPPWPGVVAVLGGASCRSLVEPDEGVLGRVMAAG